jgi:hypothetical protein
MTQPDRDYDDILSRVLHSTLDPIEPAGDGLAKIQKRIAEPWLKRQWSLYRDEFMALGWLILVRCEPYFNEARSSLTAFAVSSGRRLRSASLALSAAMARAVSGRHQDTADHDELAGGVLRRWLASTMIWLRPALAVAGAVVVVVVGVFALGQFHQTFFNTGAGSQPPGSAVVAGASHDAQGHLGAHGRHSSTLSAPSRTNKDASPADDHPIAPSGERNATQGAAVACTSSPASSPAPSPTATPSPSLSATPTPTATGTPVGTATPTSGPGASPANPPSQNFTDADASCAN